MKYGKFFKTALILVAITTVLFTAGQTFADDDDEDEYYKKTVERHREQEKKEAEKEREAAKKALERQKKEEKEEDEQRPDQNNSGSAAPAISAPQPTIIREVEQVITEIIPVDSDGDFVPDEFDEHPGEDDFAYLTDSDKDGIADALDKYPGENDAAYTVSDLNENGIVDEVENLINNPK